MHRLVKGLIIFGTLFLLMTDAALASEGYLEITDIRVVQPNVFLIQVEGPAQFGTMITDAPPRLTLYMRQSVWKVPWLTRDFDFGPVSQIRASRLEQDSTVVRIRFDLRQKVPSRIEETASGLQVQFGDTSDVERAVKVERTQPIAPEGNSGVLPGSLRSEKLIDLDVYDAEVGNVLRMLGKQAGVNIVTGSDVTGKITVSLHSVTLRQALDNILKANGYTYVVDGDVIRAKQNENFTVGDMITKVYRLHYIDAASLKEAITDVVSSSAKIQVFSTNFQNKNGVNANRAAKPGGNVSETPSARSSVLIVTDLAQNIRHIDGVVEALDVPVPQIMIEAKLIELSPGQTGELGIDWTKAVSLSLYGEMLQPSGNAMPYSARMDAPTGKVNYATLSASQFAAVLSFLRENTNSKLISNPRIIATDNEESVISVGETFPVPQVHRGVGGQGDIVTFEYKDVDISLRVRPHITDDRTITMYVNPVIEEVTGEVVIDKNRAAITSKRTVQTVVSVGDGETIVIGGLIKENKTETVSKVWLLGDIPLFGNLFRQTKLDRKQTDLLIFITPRIVETP